MSNNFVYNAITGQLDLVNEDSGGGSGTITSVNGDIGPAVLLDTGDIGEVADKKYVTDAEKTILSNTSGTNTGDETQTTIKTKLGAADSTHDGYITQTNWNTFNNKSEKQNPILLRTLNVSLFGSDTTGDGSTSLPYRTILKAISMITPPYVITEQWVIKLGPGRFIEAGDIVLPPCVSLIGESYKTTFIRVNVGTLSIKPSADWATNTCYMTIKGITFSGSTKIDFDLQAIGGTTAAIMSFQGVWSNVAVNFKGRNVAGGDYLECNDTLFYGPVLIDQVQPNWVNGYFINTLTINASLAPLGQAFANCTFASNVTLNGTYELNVQNSNSPYIGGNSLTTTGTVNLFTDSLSIPPKNLQNLSAGTIVYYVNDASTLPYYPTTSANWSTVPDYVHDALDTLAAKPSLNSKTQRKVLTSTDITNKYVTLGHTPNDVTSVQLTVIGGPDQDYSIDFSVSGTQLTWSGLGLDGVLTTNDVLKIVYTY